MFCSELNNNIDYYLICKNDLNDYYMSYPFSNLSVLMMSSGIEIPFDPKIESYLDLFLSLCNLYLYITFPSLTLYLIF